MRNSQAEPNGAGSFDPREIPAYTISEASHYLDIPPATLRSWVVGREYPVREGKRFFAPVIRLHQKTPALLSFVNLVEAHVLGAIRKRHEVALPKIRAATRFLERAFNSRHPLAEQKMQTDGCDLFVEKFGELINVSRDGQLAMREVLAAHLERVEWDPAGIASRLFLFTRRLTLQEPKNIMVDPRISFGRPVLAGTGIPTAVVAERFKAGETFEELADDYGRPRPQIEEAIRCELRLEAA